MSHSNEGSLSEHLEVFGSHFSIWPRGRPGSGLSAPFSWADKRLVTTWLYESRDDRDLPSLFPFHSIHYLLKFFVKKGHFKDRCAHVVLIYPVAFSIKKLLYRDVFEVPSA